MRNLTTLFLHFESWRDARKQYATPEPPLGAPCDCGYDACRKCGQ